MTKVLLVSATSFEIEPTLRFLEKGHSLKKNTYLFEKLQITTCVTKAGMVNTAFELGQFKGDDFDLAINVGIAGSFGKYQVGEVLNVTSDCFSELGAEDGDAFLSIDEMGLGEQRISIKSLYRSKLTETLPVTSGITVNTVHGNEQSIEKIKEQFNAGIESMEGAAFIYAANSFNWKALQLRAISNLVERRNKNNWNMPLAIKNLNDCLLHLIEELSRH
jgi:futalosine hydrolase